MQIIAKILTIREYIYRNHFLYAKDSRKFGTLNNSPYLCRQEETAQE